MARSARGATTPSAAALLAALALAGCSGGGTGAGTGVEAGPSAGEAIVIDLEPVGGSMETATATLEPGQSGGTSVLVETSGGREAQATHVRRGGCEGEEEIAFELPDVFDGIAGKTLDADFDELRSGDYAIDVHDPETGDVVACGVIQ